MQKPSKIGNCILVGNNLCGKLVSSSDLLIMLDDCLKVISVSIFIADFNLLCSEFDDITFKLLYWVILF